MKSRTLAWLPTICLLLPGVAVGQGVLLNSDASHPHRLPRPVPHPITSTQSYRIEELLAQVSLRGSIARTQVTQSFVNTGNRQMEVSFVFPLPYDGAIDQMTFMVDGKEYPARILSADEARRIYEEHVRRSQDPALVEWMGSGLFKTSVFPVPAGATRTVTLRYSQVCRVHQGLTEFVLPLRAAQYTDQPVKKVQVEVNIDSAHEIKNLYSPSHRVDIERHNGRHAKVVYSGKNEIPSADFQLLYDTGGKQLGASLLSYRPVHDEDGYFLLLVAPEFGESDKEAAVKKNIVFVVDRSGSMNGKKIEQAKGALRFVLNNLNEGDLFNIVAYDSAVETFRPELQRYNDSNRQAALGFVDGLFAGGSTNIDEALDVALSQLTEGDRPSYVVFLTDGLPTAGEKNESKIAENARRRNQARARLFSFGVGYDVNSRLLDKLSRGCFGQSQYVRPNEDIEAAVSQLYGRIGAPVLTNLKIKFELDGQPDGVSLVNRMYPRNAHDLFAGDQLVLAGRYRAAGAARIRITGTVNGSQRNFEFAGTFAKAGSDSSHAYVEKLWAVRRVGEIIDEVDLHGKNPELIDELVRLAKQHGIVTPYTSFLADESVDFRNLTRVRSRADQALDALSAVGGRSGFEQRQLKASLQRSFQVPSAAAGLGGGAQQPNANRRRMQQVGRKTFVLESGRWVDTTVTKQQEQNAVQVKRFSKEYFDLASRNRLVAQYLAFDEPVTVVVGKQAYLIE